MSTTSDDANSSDEIEQEHNISSDRVNQSTESRGNDSLANEDDESHSNTEENEAERAFNINESHSTIDQQKISVNRSDGSESNDEYVDKSKKSTNRVSDWSGESGEENEGEGDVAQTSADKGRRRVTDSDDDIYESGNKSDASNNDGDSKEKGSGDLKTLIFGSDSDEDDEEEDGDEVDKTKEISNGQPDSDDGEPRFLRVEIDSDGEQKEWDFDVMLRKKKAERKRKRRKDGSIIISDADDQVKALVDAMAEAASEDRQSNMDKRPAIQKRKMLQIVRNTLMKSDLFETLIDNGMMNAVSDWLAPLPDKSLPALEVRSTLLKILQGYPGMEQSTLKQSGLGKAVMFLFKHPKETRENKTIAAKLIREWSRPIFQLDADFRSLSREERLQRDYAHMPESKRKRLNLDEDGMPRVSTSSQASRNEDADADDAPALRPGEAGFILRARVPKPSTKDYVVRPKSLVEGRFQGPSKNRTTDRFDRAQREFRERNRSQKAKRAVGVSLEGRKMDL